MPDGPIINLTSADEHVPEIKWRIRVVKEISMAMRHSPPFHRVPNLKTIHTMINIVNMLNYLPTKAGLSTTMIPMPILNGEKLDYEKHLRFQYGQYCQVHENKTPHNINKSRT